MPNENIGHCDCPLCDKQAFVRETKKRKAYIHCDDCGFQGFARGFNADKALRGKMRKIEVKTDEGIKTVTIQPSAAIKPETIREPAPVAQVDIKPAVMPSAKELTIFDKDFWKGKEAE